MIRVPALLVACLLLVPESASAISLAQLDDFEDGTVMGWAEGLFTPSPPTNVATGGPAGAGDNYMRDASGGGPASPGGKMTVFNQLQWTGDYVAAGVGTIQIQMANFGATDLSMRLAMEGSTATRYGSTDAFPLPADAVWRTATFSLDAGGMTLIEGTGSLNDVLSGVVTLRIISRAADPGWQGDAINGIVGVDNIRAGLPSGVGDPLYPAVRLLANAPNPFTRTTVIRYELFQESPVTIDIFDLAGHPIRRVEYAAAQAAGLHEVTWDGRSKDGVAVPAGVYFYRLTSTSGVETRKMLLVRD